MNLTKLFSTASVHWLSTGNILNRVIGIKDEIGVFSQIAKPHSFYNAGHELAMEYFAYVPKIFEKYFLHLDQWFSTFFWHVDHLYLKKTYLTDHFAMLTPHEQLVETVLHIG